MKKNLDNILKVIRSKYSYLRLSDLNYMKLAQLSMQYKNGYNFINNILKKIITSNIDDEVPDFMRNISRKQIIINYIEDCLVYSNNISDNIRQINKILYFYEMIGNEGKILDLNSYLLLNCSKYKMIVENIKKNYDNIDIDGHLFQLILDSYSYTFQDEVINNNYYNINDSLSIYLNDIRNLPSYTDEQRKTLLLNALQGDKEAASKFVAANLKLVVAIAFNYRKYYDSDIMDIIQCGNEGLMKALEKYDITKGYQFSTYATWWVRRDIINYFQNKYMIRIPNFTYLKVNKVIKCRIYLEENNIPITPENISKKTGFSIKEVKKIMTIPLTVGSLDNPIDENEQDGRTIADVVASGDNLVLDVEDKMMKEKFYSIFLQMYHEKFLNDKELKILLNYNGFGGKKFTYDEIGKDLNITKQCVEQTYKRVLRKIRLSSYKYKFVDFLDDNSWVKKK